MAELETSMTAFTLPPGVLSALETAAVDAWPEIRDKLAPHVWAFYNDHKSVNFKTVFGFRVNVDSFGLVEFFLTHIFGPKT